MVIGKITSIGSLFIIGAIAVLFLRQASATSFGSAGADVGHGLSGISTGISNLFGSFINPISSIFGTIGNLFTLGQSEQSSQSQNTYGNVRAEPTAGTSRTNSTQATQSTINNIQRSSGTATTTSSGGYVNAVGVASWLK